MKPIASVLLFLVLACLAVRPAGATEQAIVLEEQLGYAWAEDVVHQHVALAEPSGLFADRVGLFRVDEKNRQRVPMQLSNVEKHADGSLRSADVWFRTDLPAKGKRTFVLASAAEPAPATSLKVSPSDETIEVTSAVAGVRLPGSAPKAVGAGPLLGVRLPSGKWTAASTVKPPDGQKIEKLATEIVTAGPIFVTTRTRYALSDGGSYTVEVTLREGEPLVRVDEQYDRAGELSIDLATNLDPTKFATKADYRGNMQHTPITHDAVKKLPSLVGWDYYLPDRTAVIGLTGAANDDLLAWVSTDPTAWQPEPYKQMMSLTAEPGGKLLARAPLASGHRAWALLVAKGASFPDPAKDLYRWWTKHFVVSLDKLASWRLVWPEMDAIEFPHTFFSKGDLPGIRARLQAEPVVHDYMENLRHSDGGYLGWGHLAGETARDPKAKARYDAYRAKYKERGGIGQGMAQISAGYLYFGDHVYLEQLHEKPGIFEMGPEEYLDDIIGCYLDGTGVISPEGRMGSMLVSDNLLTRCLALDELLGSDVLSPAEKHALLTKVAFVVYLMHQPEWQPPIHMADGSRPEGYGQGTPNQKHCAFSCRAMMACMLTNHPLKRQWIEFAMAELRPHYQWTIAESGALLESPFYSSRDTMRYAPFWSAMTRAGVAQIAPDYKQWMDRPKKAFQYLANMLTPREPRMNGKRVYHPIGRSSTGVIDPTFMIGADPWGLDDPGQGSLMRWCWEQQGKPSPDITGATGGRNIALTLLAFSHPFAPLKEVPLRSQRYEGMGAIFRSQAGSDFESNLVFRHDPFCWDLYAVNNGAVYFYGKGAPLLPRFGAYWSESYGGAWMMDLPFGNRVEFVQGDNQCMGRMTEFVSLGNLADTATGATEAKDWRRSVLLSKDLDHDDPVYLLVRDDVHRAGSASVCNWWIMSKTVAPDGLTKPGVVPIQISHKDWVANLGKNWKQAPKLAGQVQHFPGLTGVDVDLFIATPDNPQIVTDAASTGKFPYSANPALFETQQLVRISQPEGKGYLTLIAPRWPGSADPQYRAIAGGAGVTVQPPGAAKPNYLFLSDQPVEFKDANVEFHARDGFARRGPGPNVRLMVTAGRISADGITLTCTGSAALVFDGKQIRVVCPDPKTAEVTLAEPLRAMPIKKDAG